MDKPLPPILYHYTDAKGLLGVIQSKSIWATNIHYLNDSQEFSHAAQLAKFVIWERAQATADLKEKKALEFLSRANLAVGPTRTRLFVASFSKEGDSLGQWRGYCPNGAGYSIAFDAGALRREVRSQGFGMAPCIYDELSQREVIGWALDRAIASGLWVRALENATDDSSFPDVIEPWHQAFSPVAPMLKHKAFCEECEWRLISIPIRETDKIGKDPRWHFRPGRSMLTPYVEVKLAGYGPHIPAKDIIVGPTPHMELAIAAVGSLLEAEGLFDCSVRNSKVPYRTW